MTYVIAGVSGNTGRVVASTLLDAGNKVRVVVRDAKKGESWKARGAEVAVAELADTNAMAAALAGAEGAYLLLPPHPGTADYLEGERAIVESLAKAIEKAKVPHVVQLSSVGAHLPSGNGPIRTLHLAERRFRDVPGAVFTFVRAPYFMTNLAGSLGSIDQGVFATFLDPNRPVPMSSTDDIGKVAAARLLEGATKTSVVELLGLPITPTDAAKTFGAILDRELRVEVGPVSAMADVLNSVGMPKDLAALYAEMTEGFNTGRIGYEGGHAEERATTTLEPVARALLGKS